MTTTAKATIDAAIRLLRLEREAPSDVRIDYSKWSEAALSSPVAFLDEFYSSREYNCYFCGTACEFSPADKKYVYETLRKRLEWHPSLCDNCYKIRGGLERELQTFIEKWQSSRSALRVNVQALTRWLTALEELPKFRVKKDAAKIAQVRKLIRALTLPS
jgi:hypothetical protein